MISCPFSDSRSSGFHTSATIARRTQHVKHRRRFMRRRSVFGSVRLHMHSRRHVFVRRCAFLICFFSLALSLFSTLSQICEYLYVLLRKGNSMRLEFTHLACKCTPFGGPLRDLCKRLRKGVLCRVYIQCPCVFVTFTDGFTQKRKLDCVNSTSLALCSRCIRRCLP